MSMKGDSKTSDQIEYKKLDFSSSSSVFLGFKMKIQIAFAVLFLYAVCSQATELRCKYRFVDSFRGNAMVYECLGTIKTTSDDYSVSGVSGNHISGKTADDLESVYINDSPMEVLPTNIKKFYKNYRGLSIANLPNYAGFNRAQLSDHTQVTMFSAHNIPRMTEIPKDSFYDMRGLKYLLLNSLTNVRSIDADLLVNARGLEVLYMRGPNKITEIPHGFFRNQMETLRFVDFSGNNLMKVGYDTFEHSRAINTAIFYNAGCLNRIYIQNVRDVLTADIKANCVDSGDNNRNQNHKSSSKSSEN